MADADGRRKRFCRDDDYCMNKHMLIQHIRYEIWRAVRESVCLVDGNGVFRMGVCPAALAVGFSLFVSRQRNAEAVIE